jgi:hypothetical protein
MCDELHNEELHNLYSSPNIIRMIRRRMRWPWHVARMGEKDHQEAQDVGGWIILKWVLREIGWGGMDWIDLAEDRLQWRALVNTVMDLRVP